MISGKQIHCGKVLRFVGLRRAVRNLDRAIAFYTGALGFDVGDYTSHTDSSQSVHLTLGTESMELYSPGQWHESVNNENATINNTAFQHVAVVTQNMRESLKQIRHFKPQFISGDAAVHLPRGAGGVIACKFLDPDGHPLELISFPPDVGDTQWHHSIDNGLNLGIDHSAMSVIDIDRSISFYVYGLGFKINSRHFNQGVEQAHLDGVNESVVDVVALAPSTQGTPHLELLGYRVPAAQQRKIPVSIDEDHADQLVLLVDDIAAVLTNLRDMYASYDLPDSLMEAESALIRDVDGHILRLLTTGRN